MKNEKNPPLQKKEPSSRAENQKRQPATDPTHPPVSDPPVPNRAHTEMRTEFPPEFPNAPKKEF